MADQPPHESHASVQGRMHVAQCAVLTVSDSRTLETDESGALVVELLTEAGHQVVDRQRVPDDADVVHERLDLWIGQPQIDAVLITGGTGIGRRDTTIGVVRRVLTTELEGFGELFRMLSYDQVKGAAMLSQAIGGLVIRPDEAGGDTFVFAMPGSPNAVETAMKNLIAPQLAHLVGERRRPGA